MKNSLILSLSVLALGATACSHGPTFRDAQYWQRADATSAIYQQGPKAQQGLHQDISRCTAEINELHRLGSLKQAVPADETDKTGLKNWETPKRDGYMHTELLEYTDFETCMHAKGWERVEHLPYDVADRARDNWIDTIAAGDNRVKRRMMKEPEIPRSVERERDPYNTLNN